MFDPDEREPRAQTVELTRSATDLRDELPGLESERRVTDWGRSERLEALVDRTLYDFLYHYWFRVETDGLENVPTNGGALLVANHSGIVPSDAAMIAKAIHEQHRAPRRVHFVTHPRLGRVPGVGMVTTKVGGVAAHPANVHRLLFDEGELVLAFPEGRKATVKPLKERYRLRSFSPSDFITTAVRAAVPVVPVALLGAEESTPVLARLRLPGPIRRIALAPALPLPAKFKIRFLEAVPTAGADIDPVVLAHDVQALIQENLLEMVAQRRSVWLG